MSKVKGFQRFGRGVFTCGVCKRQTRETENGVTHLCAECWELAGIDNSVNDSGGETFAEYVPERDRLLKKAVKLGGAEARIKKNFPYLWPEAAA